MRVSRGCYWVIVEGEGAASGGSGSGGGESSSSTSTVSGEVEKEVTLGGKVLRGSGTLFLPFLMTQQQRRQEHTMRTAFAPDLFNCAPSRAQLYKEEAVIGNGETC